MYEIIFYFKEGKEFRVKDTQERAILILDEFHKLHDTIGVTPIKGMNNGGYAVNLKEVLFITVTPHNKA